MTGDDVLESPLSPFVQLDAWLHASLLPSLHFGDFATKVERATREVSFFPARGLRIWVDAQYSILPWAIVTLTTTKFPVSPAATRGSTAPQRPQHRPYALMLLPHASEFFLASVYSTINAWRTKFTS
jgi:hypothetical protein